MINKNYTEEKKYIINFIKTVVESNNDYVINWNIIHRYNKK